MKESHVKGLANHSGPESCVEWSDPLGEALTGENAGWVLSREKGLSSGCRPCLGMGKATINGPHWLGPLVSRAVGDPSRHGNNLRENREILRPPKQARLGRIEKSKDIRR